jgi:hypothetical protein
LFAGLLAFASFTAQAGTYDRNTRLCVGAGSTIGYALNCVAYPE